MGMGVQRVDSAQQHWEGKRTLLTLSTVGAVCRHFGTRFNDGILTWAKLSTLLPSSVADSHSEFCDVNKPWILGLRKPMVLHERYLF